MGEDVKVPIRLAPIHFCKNIRGFHTSRCPQGRGDSARASRNHEAVVFPWAQAGPLAFRLPLRKPFDSVDENKDPGRCFRVSRRHPHAPSKLL